MFWNLFGAAEEKEDRHHQDNFRGSARGEDKNGWDNESYQYCRFCDAHRRFIWDRCEHCNNN